MDLDSFALTQEEIELQDVDLGGEGEGYGKYEDYGAGGDYEGMKEEVEGASFADDDWFMARTDFTQVGELSLPKDRSRISEQVCRVAMEN